MPKYNVLVTFDASRTIEVEADSEEEAKEIGFNIIDRPCICHQCAKEVEVGDALEPVEAWLASE